jgi:cellulose biosynthesis protein BcsQ
MKHMPPIVAVASHKGGTGRTTTALALGWILGNAGQRVALVDADPVQAIALIAVAASRPGGWPNLQPSAGWPPDVDTIANADLVIVDCPSLTEPLAQPVLHRANAVLLTCLAEIYCLRTLSAATSAVATARTQNPSLALLGVVVGGYRAENPLQQRLLAFMRSDLKDLLLEPPIPWDQAIRDWPLTPGGGLPAGAAATAYTRIAAAVKSMLGARHERTSGESSGENQACARC